jgi:predicted enzyme related to lactoylglutathione lyase
MMINTQILCRRKLSVVLAVLVVGATACTTANKPEMTGMTFSSDPLLGKVIWHDLITEDLDSARAFYSGLFGWSFEDSEGNRGEDYLLARKDNVIVAGLLGVEMPNDGEKYSRWLPYVSVDDVDAAITRSTAAGAAVVAAARNVGFGRVAAITDPEGAVIGLARSKIGDPDDQTTAAAPGRAVWTELLADDPAAAAKFYGVLANYDLRVVERRGGQYLFLGSGGKDRAGIFQNPAKGEYQPVWMTAFGVADPAAAAAKAEALGGTIILPVSPELRDGTAAVVTDPSGAVLVLQTWLPAGVK